MKFLRASLFGLTLLALFLFAVWWGFSSVESQREAGIVPPVAVTLPQAPASEWAEPVVAAQPDKPDYDYVPKPRQPYVETPEVALPETTQAAANTTTNPAPAPVAAVIAPPVAAKSAPAPAAQPADEDVSKELVTLKRINFQGASTLGDRELQAAVAKFIGTPMNYEELLRVGMAVESYYREHNYLARVILPPQDLTEGVLQLDVIESVFSQVEIEKELDDMPKTQDHVVALIMAQQPLGERLNTASVERGIALANEVPGVNVKSSLHAGRDEAETELLLSMYRGRTRQAELTVDNTGSVATGVQRVMASLTFFNPSDLADLLNIAAVKTKGSEFVKMAYSLPLGFDGWRMGLNSSAMTYEVIKGEIGVVGAVGKAITHGLEWLYPWVREPNKSATVTINADAKTFQNTSSQGLVMSDYKANVVTAQVAGFVRDPDPGGGVGTYSVQVAHGSVNLDGSLNQPTDATGANTAGAFNKLKVNGTWLQYLNTKTSVFASYTGQLADKNLDSSEKMQLGGANGVRAYPTGEGSGSDAQLVSLEVRHNLDSGINLTGFYDWGQVWQQHDASYPGAPLKNEYILKGFGGSVGYTNAQGVSFKATVARRLGNNPNPTQKGTDQDGTYDRNRYWFQVSVPFW